MLKKAKKDSVSSINISLYDLNRHLLYSGSIHQLQIADAIVIEKSIEFFQDPEPCFIHRGAVISRIYGEIEQYIKINPMHRGVLLSIDEMSFKTYLSAYTEAVHLKYE